MTVLPDVVDDALEVLVVDGDIIHIDCRDVEPPNCQQAPTVPNLRTPELKRYAGGTSQA